MDARGPAVCHAADVAFLIESPRRAGGVRTPADVLAEGNPGHARPRLSSSLGRSYRHSGPGDPAWPRSMFEDEPVFDTNHPLLQLGSVICTPHIGYVSRDEWDLQFADVFEQINAFDTGTPINVVNPGVLGRRREAPQPIGPDD